MRVCRSIVAAIGCAVCVSAYARPEPGVDLPAFGAQSVWPVDGDLVRYLDLMEEMGIRWARFDLMWWSLAEREPGVYNFTSPNFPGYQGWNVDRMMTLLAERNITPFPILCYSNPFYDNETGPSTDAGRQAFANYCFAAAHRYKDSVDYWEIWNEPNLEFFWGRQPNPEDYAALVAVAAPRIRQANPNAFIVGGAVSGMDPAFLRRAFDAGLLEHVDAVSVHPYRINSPESVNGDLAVLHADIAARTTRKIEVWSSEWGYNTYWTEIDPRGQAKALLRMMVNNMAQGVQHSTWFSTHPFPEASGPVRDPEWGLVDYDFTPRPSFFAMRTLNERLAAPTAYDPSLTIATGVSPIPSGTRVAAFRRANGAITYAVWRANWPIVEHAEPTPVTLTLSPGPGHTVSGIYDGMDGSALVLPTQASTTIVIEQFPVRDYPVFVDVEPPPQATFTLY